MRDMIHPEYIDCHVTCACGHDFVTRGTKAEIKVEICSACHPFYTGKQKIVDTEGRVDRFRQRQVLAQQLQQEAEKRAEKKARAAKPKEAAPSAG